MPDRRIDSHRASGQDLAVFAHEVRGALTVISGFAELMKRPLPEGDRQAALQGISHAVKRIDRLVDSALEGSLDEGGPYEQIDLEELARWLVEEQRAITGRHIELHAMGRPVIAGAPEALERALGNLVSNALKYSLTSSPVEVSVLSEDGAAVLSVADRGPGIPEEDRERVLEPFERLGGHDDVPGTGLGLTVVRSIAESHGGSVSIAARDGGGTIVSLRLPLMTATS